MELNKNREEIISKIKALYDNITKEYEYLDKLYLQLQDLNNEEQQDTKE